MKKILKFIFPHRHKYNKPIASKYISFDTRDIIYECQCRERKVFRYRDSYNLNFPIDTNVFMTNEEFKELLTKNTK